jgi:dTDP-4-dehydrorhamnose reductase
MSVGLPNAGKSAGSGKVKVLVAGANGQLGLELQATCPYDVELFALGRNQLDICQQETISAVLAQYQPDIVVNAAAYTAVDKAESDMEQAYNVNYRGARALAQAVQAYNQQSGNLYLLHISTDFVFDGLQSKPYQPDDITKPQSIYGASKLAGEQAVLACCDNAAVIRTAWLYSSHSPNFVKTMLRLMNERDSLGVVADQVGSPTWARTLANTVWAFITQQPMGIFHCSDNGVASWYDFAVAIQDEALALGLLGKRIPIAPLRTEQYPTPARRPAFSVMDKRTTEQYLNGRLPHWRDSLRHMMLELERR